ncbi:MAG: radical SAM protein [Nanoarchaeota archaeon]
MDEKEIILILTYNCNLNCKYCPTKKVDFKTNLKIIKKLKSLLCPTENYLIKFFGGEPLLEFEHIKKIISSYPKNVRFQLTTNTVLLDFEKLQFLLENDVETRISIDGESEFQELNRGYLSKKIFGKIDKILKIDKEKKIIVNQVISPNTAEMFSKNFMFLYKLGFRRFNFLPAYYNIWSKIQILSFISETNKLIPILKKLNVEIINKSIQNKDYLFNFGLVIDCDGKIYNSNAIMINEYFDKKEQFYLGEISQINSFEDLDFNKKSRIAQNKTNFVLDRILNKFIENL